MNKFYLFLMLSLLPIALSAQKKSKIKYIIQQEDNIVVDADLKDWKSELKTIDSSYWSFNLAFSQGKLYATVRVKDIKLKNEALRNGVFLNISYDDKKKDGAIFIFPKLDAELLSKFIVDEYKSQDFTDQQLLSSVKGYQVSGFSKILDGILSFNNEYDVKAYAKIEADGSLIYESQIPLDLIKFKSEQIAVQVGINTRYAQLIKMNKNNAVGVRSAPYGRMPVQQSPSLKNPYPVDTEVWFVGNLK